MIGKWSNVCAARFRQLQATNIPALESQSEIHKQTQIITFDISLKDHINHSEYLQVSNVNQLCTSGGKLDSQRAQLESGYLSCFSRLSSLYRQCSVCVWILTICWRRCSSCSAKQNTMASLWLFVCAFSFRKQMIWGEDLVCREWCFNTGNSFIVLSEIARLACDIVLRLR